MGHCVVNGAVEWCPQSALIVLNSLNVRCLTALYATSDNQSVNRKFTVV